MKRYLLIAAVLFAAFFTIWFLVDRFNRSERERVETSDEKEVLGLTSSGSAVSSGAVKEKKDEGAATGSAVKESDLAVLSQKYTSNIVNGMFDKVMDDAFDPLKSQTTADDLKKSFDSVTEELGTYSGIESTDEYEENGYKNITVTLRYDGDEGATIRYVYDKDSHLVGLWFDSTYLAASADKGSKYTQEDIKLGRTPYVLDAKLTLPVTSEKTKPPVVIIVSQGDYDDMDGTIGAAKNRPLRDMAIGLALRGIASVRYNKRLNQYPSAALSGADIRERLIKDAHAAIDSVGYMNKIDTDAIFVLAYGSACDYMQSFIEKRIRRVHGAIMIGSKPVHKVELDYEDESTKIDSDAKYFMSKNSTFPLLFLQGDKDFETPVKYFERWQAVLRGRAHTAYHLYKQLGHYMCVSPGKMDATDYDAKEGVNAGVIGDIANWCADISKEKK
ncbi:MAG: DUF3887 domain-containing protein [Eubacterium sp.]|nr:DUF3887 domain-containing protein [Eubacterium sp.]